MSLEFVVSNQETAASTGSAIRPLRAVSGMDDDLRLQLACSIYGHSALQRYGLDPQAPIRIVVEGGHVELIGVVTGSSDRQVACSQAMSVPGVFSVTNNIVVAGN